MRMNVIKCCEEVLGKEEGNGCICKSLFNLIYQGLFYLYIVGVFKMMKIVIVDKDCLFVNE